MFCSSPPRTRRSSASSVGSNSGNLVPSTPPAITRNRSRSPAAHRAVAQTLSLKDSGRRSRSPTPRRTLTPNNTAERSRNRSRSPNANRPQQQTLSLKDSGRRSRSPTPRRTLTPNNTAEHGRGRSRSPTPNYRLNADPRPESRSPTPRRELAPTVASRMRSKSPTPRHDLNTSRPSTPMARRSRSASPKEGVHAQRSSLEISSPEEESAKSFPHFRSTKVLEDFDSVNTCSVPVQSDHLQECLASNDSPVCSNGLAQALTPSNRAVASLITDEVLKTSLEDKNLDLAVEMFSEKPDNQKGKSVDKSPGVDSSPCYRVSDNFVNHPLRGSTSNISGLDSPRHSVSKEHESGIDTTPAQRVSDNFTTHRVSVTMRRSPTPVKDVKSGVDSTPSRRISENFIATDSGSTSGKRSSKKYGSANGLDILGSTDGQTNNDSGSEVSDEGYRSLGIVPTPQASIPAQGAKSLTGRILRLYY